ncbi:MAG: hypothetical protein JWN99_581 [Ilumatobacteraceae bacterium]|nr:hypothetical protein [Ilumatobacteraceae bacterium]
MYPFGWPLDGENAFQQFDPSVDLADLSIPAHRRVGVDRGRLITGVPLDVEGDGNGRAVRPPPCLGGVVHQHAMCFVAQAPLAERCVALVAGPHLGRLDLEALAQAGAVQFFDVQVRLALAHQTGPVVEPVAAQFQPDEHTGHARLAGRGAMC